MTEEEILKALSSTAAYTEMSQLFNSKEYNEISRQLSVNNAKFSNLPEKLKLVALYLNRKGLDLYLKDAHNLLFYKKPPTIEEYLTPEFGGVICEKLYEGWHHVLSRDFSNCFTSTVPNELVITGCIGSGKTTIARFMTVWKIIQVCLLREPQAIMNVTKETVLVACLFSISLEKASLALIKPMVSLLEQSPYFYRVEKEVELMEYGKSSEFVGVPYCVKHSTVLFPNNIAITMGSNVQHALSYSAFTGLIDESEWKGNSGPESAFSLYTNVRERIRSRFLGSPYTLLTLVSSARYSQGIIADFVNSIKPDDPNTKIYSFPIWEIKHFDAYKDGGKFYVLVGNSNNPHRILSVVEQQSHDAGKFVVPQNCKVIQVPEVYRKDFEGSRISEALQNLAGEAVLFTSTYIFQDLDKIEHEELVPEVEIIVELGNSTRVIDLMPDRLFETTMNGKRFKIAPSAERFIHFDLATVNEAGIACVHIETDKDKFVYVADFVIKVKAEAKIDLAALRNFAEDLSKICYLKKLTTDQYESALFRQELTVKEVADKVEILSTIKTTEPYTTLSRLAYNSQLCVGKAPELKKQLTNTQVVNGKILLESHGRSHGDMADAICGAVYSCVMDIDSHQRIQYDVSSWKNSELVTVDSVAFKLKDWLEI